MLKNKLKIWIIHYTPLVERKKFIEKSIQNLEIPYSFITNYDKDILTKNDLLKFTDKLKHNLAVCSLFLKHIHALTFIKQSKYEFNLVLEDDIILSDNFNNLLNIALQQLPINYDMLFIGSCCNLHISKDKLVSDKLVYFKERTPTPTGGLGATRCSDSIIISKKCCINILKYYSSIKTIDDVYDFWLNHIIRLLKLNIYWMEPTITTQGTSNGKYKSSVTHYIN